MSKLNDSLVEFQTNKRKPGKRKINPINDVMSINDSWYPLGFEYGMKREYKLVVKIESSYLVDEIELVTSKHAITHEEAVKIARTAIIESVFGEFRKPLIDAKMAIMNDDEVKANQILTEIMHQMFTTEPNSL
jgi:hypothetical protein